MRHAEENYLQAVRNALVVVDELVIAHPNTGHPCLPDLAVNCIEQIVDVQRNKQKIGDSPSVGDPLYSCLFVAICDENPILPHQLGERAIYLDTQPYRDNPELLLNLIKAAEEGALALTLASFIRYILANPSAVVKVIETENDNAFNNKYLRKTSKSQEAITDELIVTCAVICKWLSKSYQFDNNPRVLTRNHLLASSRILDKVQNNLKPTNLRNIFIACIRNALLNNEIYFDLMENQEPHPARIRSLINKRIGAGQLFGWYDRKEDLLIILGNQNIINNLILKDKAYLFPKGKKIFWKKLVLERCVLPEKTGRNSTRIIINGNTDIKYTLNVKLHEIY